MRKERVAVAVAFGSQEVNIQTGEFAMVPRAVSSPSCDRRSDGASRRDAQRSGQARSASGVAGSSLPACFPGINLPKRARDKASKEALGVSPRTDRPAMIRGTASHGRLPVPPVPPHHRPPRLLPPLPPPRQASFGRRSSRMAWPLRRPSFVPSPVIMTPRQKLSMLPRVSASMHALARAVPLPFSAAAFLGPFARFGRSLVADDASIYYIPLSPLPSRCIVIRRRGERQEIESFFTIHSVELDVVRIIIVQSSFCSFLQTDVCNSEGHNRAS